MADEPEISTLDGAEARHDEMSKPSHGETERTATTSAGVIATSSEGRESPDAEDDGKARKLVHEHIAKLRQEKTQLKSRFTTLRRTVILAARKQHPDSIDTNELDDNVDDILQLLTSLASCYKSIEDYRQEQKTIDEMETVEREHRDTVMSVTMPQEPTECREDTRMRTRSQTATVHADPRPHIQTQPVMSRPTVYTSSGAMHGPPASIESDPQLLLDISEQSREGMRDDSIGLPFTEEQRLERAAHSTAEQKETEEVLRDSIDGLQLGQDQTPAIDAWNLETSATVCGEQSERNAGSHDLSLSNETERRSHATAPAHMQQQRASGYLAAASLPASDGASTICTTWHGSPSLGVQTISATAMQRNMPVSATTNVAWQQSQSPKTLHAPIVTLATSETEHLQPRTRADRVAASHTTSSISVVPSVCTYAQNAASIHNPPPSRPKPRTQQPVITQGPMTHLMAAAPYQAPTTPMTSTIPSMNTPYYRSGWPMHQQSTPQPNSMHAHTVRHAGSQQTQPGNYQSAHTVTGTPPDVWSHLRKVKIPTFEGDKHTYATWKAAFTVCVDSQPISPELKLLQLRQCLTGPPLKSIESFGYSAAAYQAAITRLEQKYGGDRRQAAVHLEALDNFQPIRQGRAKELEKFADLLQVAVINLKDTGRNAELQAGTFYTRLLQKLSANLLAQYNRWIFEQQIPESVESLLAWVTREADFQTQAMETLEGMGKPAQRPASEPRAALHRGHRGRQEAAQSSAVHHRTFMATESTESAKADACAVCSEKHATWTCRKFQELNLGQRWTLAKQKQLCYRCLNMGHRGSDCRGTKKCGVDGCVGTHHWLLHSSTPGHDTAPVGDNAAGNIPSERPTPAPRNRTRTRRSADFTGLATVAQDYEPVGSDGATNTSCVTPVAANTEGELDAPGKLTPTAHVRTVSLRTIPVILISGRRKVYANALLDDGSTASYITTAAAGALGLQGKLQQTTVNVLSGKSETFTTQPVSVTVAEVGGEYQSEVTALTINSIASGLKPVNWAATSHQWSHLEDVPFAKPTKDQSVDLLIGSDHSDLHASLQEIRGEAREPIARKTPLGWTCIGPTAAEPKYPRPGRPLPDNTFLTMQHSSPLDEIVQRFWEIDQSGVQAADDNLTPTEKEVVGQVRDSMNSLKNGGYEIRVPWNSQLQDLEPNYSMALKRLHNTEAKLRKDPKVAEAYSNTIHQYTLKGYIRQLPEPAPRGGPWLLPHFPVIRLDKSTTKVRIVFDAAAQHKGLSLNSCINPGPKLQRELLDVLLRFRRHPVAIVCDIQEMYLQIRINAEDQPYLRFLWRDPHSEEPPRVYQFERLVFGLNASPFIAHLVAQDHAKKYLSTCPLGAEAILQSTYMDDTLDSVVNEKDAVQLYRELSKIWTEAGYES